MDAIRGRHFQQGNPASWHMTAALFRQTFAHAPMLMMRLYAEDELEGLCHLGRMLLAAAWGLCALRTAPARCSMRWRIPAVRRVHWPWRPVRLILKKFCRP